MGVASFKARHPTAVPPVPWQSALSLTFPLTFPSLRSPDTSFAPPTVKLLQKFIDLQIQFGDFFIKPIMVRLQLENQMRLLLDKSFFDCQFIHLLIQLASQRRNQLMTSFNVIR